MSGTESSLQGADALLSFTVENTLSYRDETTLSLAATRPAEKDARRDLALAGRKYPVGVLPAAGLFGANASGKSAILKAMADMRRAILSSFRNRNGISFIYQPFALDPRSREESSSYAVDLIIKDVRWQYGFEINNNRVVEEYAFYFPKGRQALVFNRDREHLNFGDPLKSSDGQVLKKLSKENALLLSTAEATNATVLLPLFHWFNDNLRYVTYQNMSPRLLQTASMLQDKGFKERVSSLIRLADFGITNISRAEPDPDGEIIFLNHLRLEHLGNTISAELDPDYESTGTMTWISLIGPVLEVLHKGSLLLIDELDASLHPDLVAVLINLFQDPATNPYCAQLIFNSHDLTIFNRLGQDQIWFTEKDSQGVTTLYSLAEFRTQKKEDPYISYSKGRFGALPVLDLTEIDKALDFEPSSQEQGRGETE